MPDELKKHIKNLDLGEAAEKRVLSILAEAGREFRCLECTSKDTCENFNWHKKWFSD